MRPIRLASLLLAILALCTLPAFAGEFAGVQMSDQLTIGNQELVLNGMALRSKMMFKVYVAGLYLPAKADQADSILQADAKRHLAMCWLRKVGKEDICGGWDEGLEANTPNASSALQQQFRTLCSFMDDAKKKDLHSYTYIPGEGTRVEIGGQDKGTIEGKEFADALWACWIGPEPGPGEEFKSNLLGR